MGFAMSGMIIDKIKGVLDEFDDQCLYAESDRELIALVIYRELMDDLKKSASSQYFNTLTTFSSAFILSCLFILPCEK